MEYEQYLSEAMKDLTVKEAVEGMASWDIERLRALCLTEDDASLVASIIKLGRR